MKKALLLSAILFFSLGSISQTSNWTKLSSGTTLTLTGVSAPSPNVCYVSGVSGLIMKTSNGGTTWVTQTSGTSATLYALNFVNDNIGFAVGDNGTALKTTNGGTTWSQMAVGSLSPFRGVFFLNSSTGYIVGGTSGMILKTTNGGSTWTSTITPTLTLYGICFISPADGYAVDYNGLVVKTTNGGNTWTSSSTGSSVILSDIDFINTTTGFAIGRDGILRKTTDSGNSWTDISSGTTDALSGIAFVGSNNGFIIGGNITNNTGIILSTSNSGSSWSIDNLVTPILSFLRSISFADANTVYVVGNNGTILKYLNNVIPDANFTSSEPSCTVQSKNFTSIVSGSTGLTHSWDFGAGAVPTTSTLENPTGIVYFTEGTKSVTHIVTNGTISDTVTNIITIYPSPVSILTSQINVSCFDGNNGAATISASGGTGNLSYLWAPAGGVGSAASGLAAGYYSCSITDSNGCTSTQVVTITQPSSIITSIASQTNVSCFGGNNGAATILATDTTGTLNYLWTPTGGASASANGLAKGTYTCTITNIHNCSKNQLVTITQPNAIATIVVSQTNVSCYGGNNGAATVDVSGGTGPFTYLWAPAGGIAASANGLAAGTYTYAITDFNSCTETQSLTITQPDSLISTVTSQTNVSCFGGDNGAATIAVSGGTLAFSYIWVPAGGIAASANGLAAGTYTCTITDLHSCTKTQLITIIQPSVLSSSIASQANVSCYGGNNGAATILASGGTGTLNYLWAPFGGSAASADDLVQGTYTCTITDLNNCTKTQIAIVTQPSAITSSISSLTDASCYGANNGAATIVASGGTEPYNYLWSLTGGTEVSAIGLTAGSYTCTITDSNNCIKTQLATIIQPLSPLSFTDFFTNASCNNNDGSAGITVSGGTPPYFNLWSDLSSSQTISGIGAGVHTVTITDNNGCTIVDSIVINNFIAPQAPVICMVTVDSLSINNEIYWDKTLPEYSIVDSFIVYRYDVVSSGYLRIGAVSKNALSMFTDTARSIGGPNGGDPQYSSYQYKLAIRDTCGNVSVLSSYHQSIFVQQSNQNFSWNAYTIDGASSIGGYQFLRDDNGTGLWHVIVNTAGLATSDPNFSSYPNGKWRVQALGLSCTPTRATINKTRSNIKYANITTGIANDNNETIKIYPNPATESVTIELPQNIEVRTVKIMNVLGEIVFSETISSKAKAKLLKNINVSNLPKGMYSLVIETNNQIILKKLVVQ